MKILVIYDSIYGNTAKVAQSIGQAIKPDNMLEKINVSQVSPADLQGLDLIIAGSPTHSFKPSEAMLSFLKGLSANELTAVKAAVFDTRIDVADIKSGILRNLVKLGGFAVKHMAALLEKKGAEMVCSSEGFIVSDREGPLKDGELERATAWAQGLMVRLL